MRLTLRTLLAYLDDVLDPADKEALGKKIESSEFAEDLVHRTKDTMRRLRLSAPQVIGTGMGLDPNSVAEYLDNVMPPESVGDFERICLESDMHLAEVASCHHVLTMVLGQPADIDPAAKQRMYTIPVEAAERKKLRVESAHASAAGQQIASPPAVGAALAAQSSAPARHIEIPEYLRATGWVRFRGLFLGLAALVLVAATLYFFGGLKDWFASEPTTVAIAPPVGDVSVPAPGTTVQAPIAPAPIAPAAAPGTLEAAGGAAEPAVGPSAAAPAAESPRYPVATAPPVGVGVGGDPARSGEAPNPYTVAPTPETPPYAATPQETTTASALRDTMPAPAVAPEAATTPDTSATVSVDPDGTVRVADSGPATVEAAAPPESISAVEPETPKVVELGTYRGGRTVLLRYDDAAGTWLRVVPRSAVVKGERLLALPEFRPIITLTSGVHLDLLGGTLVALDADDGATAVPPAEADSPAIEVVYGRIVLINTSSEERPVRLVLGSTSAEARLAHSATLAIEVERKYVPGSDPRKTPAPLVARLYVPDGGVVWQDASGPTTLDKPSEWTIADGVPTAVVANASPPAWIDQEAAAQSSEQRFATPVVDGTLVANRPADVQLLELFQGNGRREVKSLVARSGMHVGLYVPFIEALRDSAQRPNWNTHIESLRSAMAMSPESAEKIRQALVEQRGDAAAADLYEMLCGYNADQIGRTPEQVKTGAIARLIDWLEKDSLDYRVLAVHDLWEITGKQLMPNPAGSASDRTRNIRQWRNRLEAGDLTPVAGE